MKVPVLPGLPLSSLSLVAVALGSWVVPLDLQSALASFLGTVCVYFCSCPLYQLIGGWG